MAIRLLEGFELDRHATYLGRRCSTVSGTVTFSRDGRLQGYAATGPPSGGPHWRYNALTPAVLNQWVIGFGYKAPAAISSGTQTNWSGISMHSGAGNAQFILYPERLDDETIRWNLRRGSEVDNGSSLGTSTPFNPKIWHYFELKINIRTGTNGSAVLRMHDIYGNVTTILTVTGVNTAHQGTDGADVFAMQIRSYPNHTPDFDDVYVLDTSAGNHTDFLGPVVIESCHTDGAGLYTEWDPDPAHLSNHVLVNDSETTPTDTDFVDDDGTGSPQARDLYTYRNATWARGDVVAVELQTACKVDITNNESFHNFMRNSSGTEHDGTSRTTNSITMVTFHELMDQDPVALAAWTSSNLDSYQFGVERE